MVGQDFVMTPCHMRRRTSAYATASVCPGDIIDMDDPEYVKEHGTLTTDEYPGRQSINGLCTSLDEEKGKTCDDLIWGQPSHVTAGTDNRGAPSECRALVATKLVVDRYGRPLTIRYVHKGETHIAKREQVCNIIGYKVSSNRSEIAEEMDDRIWKNLTIWAQDHEHKWSSGPNAKAQYLKCHAAIAAYHCSAMFPNCTAEFNDHKPSLPCKDICQDAKIHCKFGNRNFLDRELQCDSHPERPLLSTLEEVEAGDALVYGVPEWQQCTAMYPMKTYMTRVSGASRLLLSYGTMTMLVLSMILAHVDLLT